MAVLLKAENEPFISTSGTRPCLQSRHVAPLQMPKMDKPLKHFYYLISFLGVKEARNFAK